MGAFLGPSDRELKEIYRGSSSHLQKGKLFSSKVGLRKSITARAAVTKEALGDKPDDKSRKKSVNDQGSAHRSSVAGTVASQESEVGGDAHSQASVSHGRQSGLEDEPKVESTRER